ncbi:hypothetical protein Adt_32405 [Abeliophyllum distichum]|uniref:Uncharacterized protein n=1 Tax=Abeliophyllum distichum TaxID=126358 RepID=A0ABD1QWX8_9LAMI
MFTALKGGLDKSSMFWRDVQRQKPHDYNASVDLMKEEIIFEEMARARDSYAQQRYNHRGQVNAKPLDGGARHQAGHRQGGHPHPFTGIGSSYAVEITEAIPNLHAGVNTPNQGLSAREAGSSKSKKLFYQTLLRLSQFL